MAQGGLQISAVEKTSKLVRRKRRRQPNRQSQIASALDPTDIANEGFIQSVRIKRGNDRLPVRVHADPKAS